MVIPREGCHPPMTLQIDVDAQNRFIKIAQHYRTLANGEERDAERKGVERRSGTSDKLG